MSMVILAPLSIVRIVSLSSVIFFCLLTTAFADELVVYPQIPGRPLSATYTVTVNGQAVPVQLYNGISFVWFAFSGNANVTITVKQNVSSYTLSPIRNQIPSTVSGANITFSLSQPRKLVLRKVNALSEELFVLADALEVSPPASSGTGIFNIVTGYGADPTGVAPATTAINNAITAANAYGTGSVVYVPAGVFSITNSLLLKTNVHLYLAPGSVIKVQAGSYTSGIVLIISQTSNAKVSGRGILYGRQSEGNGSYSWLVHTNQAVNLTVQDIMILDSVTTGFRIAESTNTTADNVKVFSGSPNLSDGIDLESNTNVTVSNSVVYSSDDSIAIGSGTNILHYDVGAPTDGIRLTGNLFEHVNGGTYGHVLSIVPHIGTSYIQNIIFDNNDSIYVWDGLSIYPFGGTNVSAVTMSNSSFEQIAHKPIEFLAVDCTSWGPGNCGSPAGVLGYIHNISITNVTFGNFGTQSTVFQGYSPTADINGVLFNNFRIGGNLVTNVASANMNIGPYVSNIVFASNPNPPPTPQGLRVQ